VGGKNPCKGRFRSDPGLAQIGIRRKPGYIGRAGAAGSLPAFFLRHTTWGAHVSQAVEPASLSSTRCSPPAITGDLTGGGGHLPAIWFRHKKMVAAQLRAPANQNPGDVQATSVPYILAKPSANLREAGTGSVFEGRAIFMVLESTRPGGGTPTNVIGNRALNKDQIRGAIQTAGKNPKKARMLTLGYEADRYVERELATDYSRADFERWGAII